LMLGFMELIQMRHLDSKRTGNSAEINLMDMLKNNKNKHRYVSIKLSEFSRIMKIIIDGYYDIRTTKYLLKIHREEYVRNIDDSTLVGDEKTHLINAIKTRYMKVIRELKLPLNTGEEK